MGALDLRRLVLTKVSRDGGAKSSGTGYAVTEDLVHTARHVYAGKTGEAPPRSAEVRFIGADEPWQAAELCWTGKGDLDACLLRLRTPRELTSKVRWGSYDRERRQPLEWESCGFPQVAAERRADGVLLRDTAGVRGSVEPGSCLRSGLLELTVEAAPRKFEDWQGLSGAPCSVTERSSPSSPWRAGAGSATGSGPRR